MVENQDRVRLEQDIGHDMGQRVPGPSHESSEGEEERRDTVNVNNDTVAVNNSTSALAAQIAQPNSGLETVGVPATAQSVNQVFTTHFYQILPHPLSHLMKELPVVDGSDVNLLCFLMTQVLKIRQIGQMTESTIYEIMYPCCRSELLAFVTQAITTRQKLENFRASLLGQFIPSRQMSQLRAERYEIVQFEGEPFATYVQSIRDAALVLRIKENEKQFVERTVEGITSIQRARFVFQAPPASFLQGDTKNGNF